MTSVKLKACPFCGGRARVSTREKLFIGWNGFGTKKIEYAAQVICNKCYARGGLVTEIFVTDSQLKYNLELLRGRAIEAWNARENDPQKVGRWISHSDYDAIECSVCGSAFSYKLSADVCPSCGARMTGGDA